MSVTDMLIAILNCCTKEELEEEDETPMITPESPEIEQGKLPSASYPKDCQLT
jgi:serine/threonine-protein phosphatase 2B catalytic subunit